jgi:hypothetical protein
VAVSTLVCLDALAITTGFSFWSKQNSLGLVAPFTEKVGVHCGLVLHSLNALS